MKMDSNENRLKQLFDEYLAKKSSNGLLDEACNDRFQIKLQLMGPERAGTASRYKRMRKSQHVLLIQFRETCYFFHTLKNSAGQLDRANGSVFRPHIKNWFV